MIALLVLSSCTRRQEPRAAGLSPPAVKEAAGADRRTDITLQKEEASALPALTPARQEHVMLPLERGRRTLPEDFKIGLLGDRLAGDREQAELLDLVSGFLDDLTRKSVSSETLLPESAPTLARSLAYHLERGNVPGSYRLGSLIFSPDSEQARLGIRLFTAEDTLAACEGVLYLERHAEQWLIADLQIDLQALAAPGEREGRKFMPSSYRWLVGGS